jgi:hypothetical protein
MLRFLGIAVLAIAAGGGYYAYTNYFHAQTVTTSVATMAPVSEAIYGTGTVEPARWPRWCRCSAGGWSISAPARDRQ